MTDAPTSTLQLIFARVSERLDAIGLTGREACRRAGLNPDSIRNIRRAVEQGVPGRVGVSSRTIAALAPVLGTTTDWLLEGTSDGLGPLLVDWFEVGRYADPHERLKGGSQLGAQFGRWPESYFATRTPDDAMNRLSPVGSYLLIDRNDRALVEGKMYLGVLGDEVIFRKWACDPERAEPCSTDPVFRTEFPTPKRRWKIIGRVQRTILDV